MEEKMGEWKGGKGERRKGEGEGVGRGRRPPHSEGCPEL